MSAPAFSVFVPEQPLVLGKPGVPELGGALPSWWPRLGCESRWPVGVRFSGWGPGVLPQRQPVQVSP